jgi:hypothetical protein
MRGITKRALTKLGTDYFGAMHCPRDAATKLNKLATGERF